MRIRVSRSASLRSRRRRLWRSDTSRRMTLCHSWLASKLRNAARRASTGSPNTSFSRASAIGVGRIGLIPCGESSQPVRDPAGLAVGVEPVPVRLRLFGIAPIVRGQAPNEELPVRQQRTSRQVAEQQPARFRSSPARIISSDCRIRLASRAVSAGMSWIRSG